MENQEEKFVDLNFENQQSSTKKVNFDSISVQERLSHSNYDARKNGVEELIRKFTNEEDLSGGSFSEFQEFLPKLVGDKNVLVVEKSLEALKIFIEKFKDSTRFEILTYLDQQRKLSL